MICGLCESCGQDKPLVVASVNSAYDYLCHSCDSAEKRERRRLLNEIRRESEEMGLYEELES